MVQEYRISKGLIYVLTAALLAFAAAPWFFVPILSSGSGGRTVVFFICWTIAWLTGAALALVEGIRWKLVVDGQSLRLTTAFKMRTVLLAGIRGYRQARNGIFLILYDETQKPVQLSMHTSDNAALRDWITHAFPDLGTADGEAAQAAILADEALGENEAQRTMRFANYKLIARLLAVTSYLLMFAALFRYDLMLLVVCIPFACFWLMLHSNGRIMVETEKGKGSSSITLALIVSCLTASLNGILNTPSLVDWHPLIPHYGLGAGLILCPFLYIMKKYGKLQAGHGFSIIACAIVMALPFGAGVSLYANFHFNKPVLKSYHSTVIGKRISTGKHTTRYIRFMPVGPLREPTDFTVGSAAYDSYQTGDPIKVVFGKGCLGATWYIASH